MGCAGGSERCARQIGTVPSSRPSVSTGCETLKWRLGSPASLPVVFKAGVEVAAPKGHDRVSSPHGPEHSGPFESRSDHSFAAGLDDARTNKQVLESERWVAHALSIPFEIVGLRAKLLSYFGIG